MANKHTKKRKRSRSPSSSSSSSSSSPSDRGRRRDRRGGSPSNRDKSEKAKRRRDSRDQRSPDQKKRERSRSRSPARKRDRNEKSRDKSRSRSKSPDRERDRKGKRSRRSDNRDRSRSKSAKRERVKAKKSRREERERRASPHQRATGSAEMEATDQEMMKRKQRLEQWRSDVQKTGGETSEAQREDDEPPTGSDALEGLMSVDEVELQIQERRERIQKWREAKNMGPRVNVLPVSRKTFSLENDDEEEEAEERKEGAGNSQEGGESANKADVVADEEEEDPLDAFMKTLKEDTSTGRAAGGGKSIEVTERSKDGKKVTSIVAVNRKWAGGERAKEKAELMESNADAMEYSSEEGQEGDDLEEAMNKMAKNKRELKTVDHGRVYYRPFRKDFYVEVPEIGSMTDEEVQRYRRDLENVAVRGKNCPRPIKTWAQAGVGKRVLEILKRNGYERPTPIQAQALPIVMSGRDMIGTAKTGSGKTLAFLLPMFRHVLDQPELEPEDGPIALIMTPTRELAVQIWKECQKFTRALGLRAVCVFGGAGTSEQIAELKRGAEIVVCTPGRMIDMLAANSGRVTNLRRTTYVVLDEADRMFDLGFEPQVMRIVGNVRPDRMTVMFSATFPRQMEALARKVLTRPIEVSVGGRSVVCDDVEQRIVVLEGAGLKFLKLLELLGVYQEQGPVIVFVHAQEVADELMASLGRHSYPALSLHGGLDQYDRLHSIGEFKSGNARLLVATSVGARGLDVKDLVLVVNYDCPAHYEDYVHRCGRTGRAGKKGYAYTFVTPDQGAYAGFLVKALQASKADVPAELSELWNEHSKDMEEQGKKPSLGNGFRGRGFKFDEAEAQQVEERKRLQKAGLGIRDSDEDDCEDEDVDRHIEELFASRTKVSDAAAVEMAVSTKEKLEMAQKAALQVSALRNIGSDGSSYPDQGLVNSILSGGSAPATTSAASNKAMAEQAAKRINAKLGFDPAEERAREEQEEAEAAAAAGLAGHGQGKRYEEELEINDFPQNARWKVTSKEVLGQISELSEAGVTVRGVHVPPNKQPKEGERKLYLTIEATSEMAVQIAKAEIKRLIKEELVRAQFGAHSFNKGRYKVL